MMDGVTISDPVAAAVAELNKTHFVVNEAGKVMIYREWYDRVMRRRVFDRLSFGDFSKLYCNQLIEVGTTKKGRPIMRPLPDVWINHEERRQYVGGIVFDPSAPAGDGGDTFNLWQGFAVEPRRGSWSRLKDHIRTVICDGHAEHYGYLLDWMADVVQRPAKQGEVAVVLRGVEGCGKGVLARAMLHLLGQHGHHISNAKHLIGNFNGHLRDCILLFADEAFFAGDKSHTGVLKALVTEPTLAIEGKFQAVVRAVNLLHIIMASNEEWVVPASLRSRRWFVLDVSPEKVGDHAYFAAIYTELEQGGYEAMLHELLTRDLSAANIRAVPTTEALQTQRAQTLDTTHAWWQDVLMRGYVFESRLGLEDTFEQWRPFVSTELLYASYMAHCDQHHEHHPLSRERLGAWLTHTLKVKPGRLRSQLTGEHMVDAEHARQFQGQATIHHNRVAEAVLGFAHGYQLGELEEARETFVQTTGLSPEWPKDAP